MSAAPATKKPRLTRDAHAAAVASAGLSLAAQPAGVAAPIPTTVEESPLVSTIRLNLDQVDPYEHNPRSKRNQKFFDIKESIRARGLDTLMWVTRRPGSKRYVLAKGGGTRYAVLRELWEETQERKFFELDFNYCEYKSDMDIMAGHMSENLNRDDMCFWDKAKGCVDLKHKIEEEFGAMTYDGLIAKFKELGVPEISKSSMALYQFAFDYLYDLCDGIFELKMLPVRDILQPGYNSCLRLLKKSPKPELDFEARIWRPTLAAFGKRDTDDWDWSALMDGVEAALAEELGVEHSVLLGMLATLKTTSRGEAEELTWEQLLPPPPSSSTGTATAGGQRAPAGADGGQTSPTTPATGPVSADNDAGGVRINQTPQTFASTGDSDRPPAAIVTQVEAEQKARAAAAAEAEVGRKKIPPLPSTSAVAGQAPQTSFPTVATITPFPTGGRDGIDQQKRALRDLAGQLAGRSRTLENLVIQHDGLPIGWMLEIPQEVLDETLALPPLAKQIFWFLAHASFQISLGMDQPDRVAGTRFAQFLVTAGPQQWGLVQPDNGLNFLMSWLIDPEYVALAIPAMRLLTLTRDLVANHPDEFLDLSQTLDFEELQENAQAQRQEAEQEALDYFVEAGASPEIVRRLFPGADLATLRFRPGRIAEIDLKTAQRLYDVWEAICQETATERTRYMRLHQAFPDHTMASLYSAIHDVQ